jgi:hypothetical protein
MGTPGTRTQNPRAVADTAQDDGNQLAHSAADSTKQVAETVKGEASKVAGEVSTQVRSLVGQASDEVRGQVEQQRSRAAGALRTTADEFASLAGKEEYSRLTGELTRRAAEQTWRVADYLERTRPTELVERVRSFARRRPGAFLLAAALGGAVTGRVLKGAIGRADQPSTEPSSPGMAPSSTSPTSATNYRSTGSGFAEPLPTPPAPVTGAPPTGGVATGTAPARVAEPIAPDPGTAGSVVTDSATGGRGGTTPRGDLP